MYSFLNYHDISIKHIIMVYITAFKLLFGGLMFQATVPLPTGVCFIISINCLNVFTQQEFVHVNFMWIYCKIYAIFEFISLHVNLIKQMSDEFNMDFTWHECSQFISHEFHIKVFGWVFTRKLLYEIYINFMLNLWKFHVIFILISCDIIIISCEIQMNKNLVLYPTFTIYTPHQAYMPSRWHIHLPYLSVILGLHIIIWMYLW